MAVQISLPRALDANGDPLSGALCYVYETGTTTPLTTYQEPALSTAHANPIVADSAGWFDQAFYNGAVAAKLVVKTSAGVDVRTFDPAIVDSGTGSAASAVSFTPTAGIPDSNVQDAIEQVQANFTGRTLSAGAGLTGGGDLSANRTFAVDVASAADLAAGTANKMVDAAEAKTFIEARRTRETALTTSGASSYGFTGIVAGANRITVMFSGVSLSGTDDILIQIGDSGGYETTGYSATSVLQDGSGNNVQSSTAGYPINSLGASTVVSGAITLARIDGNTWVAFGTLANPPGDDTITVAGTKTLSAELDRVQVKPTGSDTFDGGTVNIIVET